MTTACPLELLQSALAGTLSQCDEVQLHRHLEVCEECSAALEQMAGGASWCHEAAAMLTHDELDSALTAGNECSEADFAVEFLEPANGTELLGRLGGYDVLKIIGRGGMGVVLKGFDPELKRSVAIKILSPHLACSSLAKKRFAREAQAAAAVVHPNVMAIYQVQASGRLPFLVMPLVGGESLAQRLAAKGTLELTEILRIGMQAAAGLAAAHEQGLVHRDVKPANILLEKGVERAVLTDFGLARAVDDVALTRWGIIAGTPQYMSPEQSRGEPLDGRSDLFSLGCVLYEMATGVAPFRADTTIATLRRVLDDAPQPMASLNRELPPWFSALVDRLLEKDPAQRFHSAHELSDLLEQCLAHLQQPAIAPVPASLAPKRTGRLRNVSFRKGVIAVLTTLGIAIWGIFLGQTPENKRSGAEDEVAVRQDAKSVRLAWFPRYSPDGKWLATAHGHWNANEEGEVRVWDAQTGKPRFVIPMPRGVRTVAWGPKGTFFVSGDYGGMVTFYDAQRGQRTDEMKLARNVEVLQFLPDERRLVAAVGDGSVYVFGLPSRERLHAWKRLHRKVWGMAISPDGKTLCTSGQDHVAHLLDMDNYEILHRLEHPTDVNGVVFTEDGKHVLTGCGDKVIRVFDVETGNEVGRLEGHKQGSVTDLCFAPGGKLLASCGMDGSVRLWDFADFANPKLAETLDGANNVVFGVAMSPDGKRLAFCGWNNQIRVIDLDTRKPKWSWQPSSPTEDEP
jgi:serine/threonine-protein kinase